MLRAPAFALLATAILVAGCLKQADPQGELIQPDDEAALVLRPASLEPVADESAPAPATSAPATTTPPTTAPSTSPPPAQSTPTPSPASSSAPASSPSPADDSAAGSTANATTNTTTNATSDATGANASAAGAPPILESNESVRWNATLGARQQCVATFGLPVCAPLEGGDASRMKLMGNADVARGVLTLSWDEDEFAEDLTIRLALGKGCDDDGCTTLSATNATKTGASPLKLNVKAVDLKANQTLVLIVETATCSDGLGACAPQELRFLVEGWLVRVA